MNGYKTYIAGGGTILLGLAQTLLAVSSPETSATVQDGLQSILAGLAIIGVGHKLDKAS